MYSPNSRIYGRDAICLQLNERAENGVIRQSWIHGHERIEKVSEAKIVELDHFHTLLFSQIHTQLNKTSLT
ncbi:hypothetical protein RchiOBHm_Chr4g0394591 [Rosa chinensis]|uniref:Uncharacterized protein n=1 Tax=Rosa chinensis TaxID=74649 RepID=A0A2P6QRD0_ROSCH|nr:hypothetical protein RchiOBHm_Chr4g0394591 [Rosa chinensis]